MESSVKQNLNKREVDIKKSTTSFGFEYLQSLIQLLAKYEKLKDSSHISISYRRVTIFLCFLFSLICCVDHDVNFEKIIISKYPENKGAAISFTFDDGFPSGYNIIAPIFEEYNYRASFFLIAGNIKDDATWKIWRDLNAKGFEIGNHSLTHLNLKTVYDTAILRQEIYVSYNTIGEKIGKAPFTFVHPYHTTNPVADALIFTKHFATRKSPAGFCSWEAWPSDTDEQYIKKKIDEIIKKGLWYVPCAHGIGDSCCPISEELLRSILDYVKAKESQLFVGSFENIAKYSLERDNTKLIVSTTEVGEVVELRSTLDPVVFDLPLLIIVRNRLITASEISSLRGEFSSKQVGNDTFVYAKPNSILIIKK